MNTNDDSNQLNKILAILKNQESYEKEYGQAQLWREIKKGLKKGIITQPDNTMSEEELDEWLENSLINEFSGDIFAFWEEYHPELIESLTEKLMANGVSIDAIRRFYK